MDKKSAISQLISNVSEHSGSLLLLMLLSVDLVFIALHSISALTRWFIHHDTRHVFIAVDSVSVIFSFLHNPRYSIERDGGYPELYQYLKWFWVTGLLVNISISRRSLSYISWALLFLYFLCDDALSIHEHVGGYIAGNLTLTPPFGLRLQDVGEFVVSAVAGMFLFPLVIWAYFIGPQAFRKMSQDILILILALVFFGVFVDMLHVIIRLGKEVEFVFGVIEDGGEMLVASLILWYVFLISVRAENPTSYFCDFVRAALTKRST